MEKFSKRHGFQSPEPEITVTHDAPYALRGIVIDIAYESGLGPHSMRSVVCGALRVREDPLNWSAYPNVDQEVRQHLDSCEWFEAYDIIEATYRNLAQAARHQPGLSEPKPQPRHFEEEMNKYFRKAGIGWQLIDGKIQVRGEHAFEKAVAAAKAILNERGRSTARSEIAEALRDLSRRPEPDLTGALHHGLAALECAMREASGDRKATLGALISRYKGIIPAPLDQAVEKLWGFASEQGRHVSEGRKPEPEEVELAVHVAAAVIVYILKKQGG